MNISSLGSGGLHIGGGEPFLHFDELLTSVGIFREEGMRQDYLETNASWYSDQDSARERLARLMDAGCETLMVSICPFHIEFVPLYKAEGVLEVCADYPSGGSADVGPEEFYRFG